MLSSLKFLYYLTNTPKSVVSKTKYITIEDRHFLIKHFKSKFLNNERGIILFPGFSVYGYRDTRIKALAQAFAAIGFNVYLIALEDLEKLQISSHLIDEMCLCIDYISSKKKLNKSGKVAIVAPSFSAGMSLIAASKTHTKDRISAICTIGTYASLDSSFDYVMKDEVDDYARNILLKNLLKHTPLESKPELEKLLDTAIKDNGFKRVEAQLPWALENVPETSKALWLELGNNASFRMSVLKEALSSSSELKTLASELNVFNQVKQITAPTFLLHGEQDLVISCEESKSIHEERINNYLPSHLLLSPLIDHGDTQLGLKNWKDIWKLLRFFSQFFNKA